MYQVKFYKGDYRDRQHQANMDYCDGYIEQHFNSSANPGANYSVVVVGSNASRTSKNWGRWYAAAVAHEFDCPVGGDNGIMVGGFNGRGDANLRLTSMPAILLESLFCSNPTQAEAALLNLPQTNKLCSFPADFFVEFKRCFIVSVCQELKT